MFPDPASCCLLHALLRAVLRFTSAFLCFSLFCVLGMNLCYFLRRRKKKKRLFCIHGLKRARLWSNNSLISMKAADLIHCFCTGRGGWNIQGRGFGWQNIRFVFPGLNWLNIEAVRYDYGLCCIWTVRHKACTFIFRRQLSVSSAFLLFPTLLTRKLFSLVFASSSFIWWSLPLINDAVI